MNTCRICLKGDSAATKQKWFDIDAFIPIMQLLAKTKIFTHTESPKKICGSCANGLIMANLFRMKVIESNKTCRDLCLNNEVAVKVENIVQKSEDLPMYEEYLDESFLKEIEPPVVHQKPEKFIVLSRKIKRAPFTKKRMRESPDESWGKCCLCRVNSVSYQLNSLTDILEKISKYDGVKPQEQICVSCRKKIKNAQSYFTRESEPYDFEFSLKRSPCQFCMKRCREVRKASFSLVETFFQLPPPPGPRSIIVGGRCCTICVKHLSSIMDLRKMLLEKQKEAVKLEEPAKKEAKETFDDSVVRIVDEDYQCHMSEIDDDDAKSDTSMPDVLFGEPLNIVPQDDWTLCPSCKFATTDAARLDAHKEIYHNTTSNICNICHNQFATVKICKDHKRRMHFMQEHNNYYKKLCEICGLSTKFLDGHYSQHTNIKPYSCDICQHRSRTKVRIMEHILAMHTNFKRYGCSYCDRRFSYFPDKARHEISNHTKKYKYICEVCNKCFVKKNFLRAHQETHEGHVMKIL